MNLPTDQLVKGTQSPGKKPVVSIIVPIYNAESYLRRCIDSLIGQTLQNLEIILIDDGSTDNSGHICDEYVTKDSRILVVHQENAGVSEARNTGIDRASADYLMFVDSDDWVEPNFCEVPLSIAKECKADLVMFLYRPYKNGPGRIKHSPFREGVITQEEAFRLVGFTNNPAFYPWNKLYHRSLFDNCCYPSGKVLEDIALTPMLIHRAKRIAFTQAILYNYNRTNENSITVCRSAQVAKDYFDAISLTTQHLEEWGFQEMAEHFYQQRMLILAGWSWADSDLKDECCHYFRGLKKCPTHFSLVNRCMYYLLILSPELYRLIYRAYLKLRH